jgi:CRP/FNR family transcriptional regulator
MLDDELRGSLAQSALRDLDADILARITEGARRLDVAPGAVRDIGSVMFDLVLHGLMRVFVIAPDGREATLRYCRRGSLMGTSTIFSPVPTVAGQKALVPSRILVMRPAIVRSLAETDARVALALLRETSDRTQAYITMAGGQVLSSLRQRIAAHLLEMANVPDAGGSELVVAGEQQRIADAVGTVREVVVRVLRDFREAGLVRTTRHGTIIADAVGLEAETWWRDL